ncbi:uncharacterized protein (DUF1697 family) [Mycetocola sp. CAN_C7]|uniref:DUF1697 domain-containing protein n=1 Tax=Mycetocola sp. CAN_C7 TaxID=2787724 RepID=UPI0018CA3DE1
MTGSLRIALLRGVNVGGITVKSAQLAEVFRGLGFDEVRTVLASGNVLFAGQGGPSEQTATIEKGLSDAFGYQARVIVTDQAAVDAIVAAYPFDEVDDRQPYVIFAQTADDLPTLVDLAGDLDPEIERVRAGDGVLYWEVRKGMSTDSAFSKRTARTPGILTTTRNLRTLRKLL